MSVSTYVPPPHLLIWTKNGSRVCYCPVQSPVVGAWTADGSGTVGCHIVGGRLQGMHGLMPGAGHGRPHRECMGSPTCINDVTMCNYTK